MLGEHAAADAVVLCVCARPLCIVCLHPFLLSIWLRSSLGVLSAAIFPCSDSLQVCVLESVQLLTNMMDISEAELAHAAHANGLDHWQPIM